MILTKFDLGVCILIAIVISIGYAYIWRIAVRNREERYKDDGDR